MMKSSAFVFAAVAAFAGFSASSAHASSSFQNTCSNIEFVYQGDDAALSATCLRANGTPNASVLLIRGVSNQNGTLTVGSGASSFQKSCGNIEITAAPEGQVFLSAFCRTTSGSFKTNRIELDGISNNNGNLTY